MILRDYQIKAINEVIAAWKQGHRRVLLQLACGGGKTKIFTKLMSMVAEKNKRSVMVVRGKELVTQTQERLRSDRLECDIYQGSNTDVSGKLITVASIDTLNKRAAYPDCDLLVIDEAHLSFGKIYQKLLDKYPNAKILAVTATPYSKKGFQHIADKIVYPISIRELQDKGYLVKGKYYALERPDLSNVSKIGDDYNSHELSRAMQAAIGGNFIREWREKANDRPTICFCVDREHARAVQTKLIENGIAAEYIDGDTSSEDRGIILSKIGKEIKIVVSIGVLTTGVDIPCVSCLIMLRPTMSKSLWFQMLGRATRPYPGKSDFIVLDHADNTMRLDMIEEETIGNLEAKPKKPMSPDAFLVTCKECFAVFRGIKCPDCGLVVEREKKSGRIFEKMQLHLLSLERKEKKTVQRIILKAKKNNYARGWCMFRLEDKKGKEQGYALYMKYVYPYPWDQQPNIINSLIESSSV